MQAPTQEIAKVYIVFGPHREPHTLTPRHEIALRSDDTTRLQCLLQVLQLSYVFRVKEAPDAGHLLSQSQQQGEAAPSLLLRAPR